MARGIVRFADKYRHQIFIVSIALASFSIVGAQSATYSIINLERDEPAGINTPGQVVIQNRYELFFVQPLAAIWENGIVRDLGVPAGYTAATGYGINVYGDIAGSAQFSTATGVARHAHLWMSTGTAVDLGTLAGAISSHANAVNNLSSVVGWSGSGNSGSGNWSKLCAVAVEHDNRAGSTIWRLR